MPVDRAVNGALRTKSTSWHQKLWKFWIDQFWWALLLIKSDGSEARGARDVFLQAGSPPVGLLGERFWLFLLVIRATTTKLSFCNCDVGPWYDPG